jgi:hypothetical protein
MSQLEFLTAATENTPALRYLPPMGTQESMMSALARIGLVPHSAIKANAIDHLNASGTKFNVYDVDRALKEKTTLTVQQKLQFKIALDRAGLLKS